MATVEQLRAKRVHAGIPGSVLCVKVGRSRSWLSDVERGYRTVTDQEAETLDAALEALLHARREAEALAHMLGWPDPRVSLGGVSQ